MEPTEKEDTEAPADEAVTDAKKAKEDSSTVDADSEKKETENGQEAEDSVETESSVVEEKVDIIVERKSKTPSPGRKKRMSESKTEGSPTTEEHTGRGRPLRQKASPTKDEEKQKV